MRARRTAVSGFSLTLLLAVGAFATGCGSTQPPSVPGGGALLRAGDLAGWKSVRVEPGLGELAPDLSGLKATGRIEAPALVHAGDAVRATAFVFATSADATEALDRGREPGYASFLEHAFGGAAVAHGPGVGYRLHITRGSEPGSDTAEVYLVAGGAKLALVEIVSGGGLAGGDRNRVLQLIRARLRR